MILTQCGLDKRPGESNSGMSAQSSVLDLENTGTQCLLELCIIQRENEMKGRVWIQYHTKYLYAAY